MDFTGEGDRAAEIAVANPDNFVLKPAKEGGGNNVFGSKIVSALEKLEENKERPAWILMEKIFSPAETNYFIRPKSEFDYDAIKSVYELGIFSVVIGDSEKILYSKEVSNGLLRAKESHVDEAGIMSGAGVLSSIYFT